MGAADPTPVTQLVQAFFSETADAFRPLVAAPSAQWTPSLRHATRNGPELTTPDRIEGFFFAECEFHTSDLIGDISFGDREFFINTVVSPRGRPHRYGLWEWADALDRPDLVPRATDFVFQLDRLREIVRGMATGLLELRTDIVRADASTLERLEKARATVRATHEAQWRESEHRGTVAKANDAFRQQRWERVVELLESIRDRLSPAETQKLAYARKRVTESSRPPR